jgi:lysozyme
MQKLLNEWRQYLTETAKGLPSFGYSEKAIDLIKKYESFRSKPYLDGEGKATIGYGTRRYPSGKPVTLKDKAINKEQAHEFLINSMNFVVQGINKFMATKKKVDKKGNPIILNQNQIDALTSLGYNIGRSALVNSDAYSRATRKPDDPKIRDYFMQWQNEPGHERRRKEEADLYFTPVS